jgi:transposase-like protein
LAVADRSRGMRSTITLQSIHENSMLTMPAEPELKVVCPNCGSEAIYRYGRVASGKQRYICIICRKQFSPAARRPEPRNKRVCPECGAIMHVYMKTDETVRYRCSNYPECKTYIKDNSEKENG